MKCLSILVLLTIWLTLSVTSTTSSNITDLMNLDKFLKLQNPQKLRPVINQSNPILVNIDVLMLALLKVDHARQTLDLSLGFNISWKDELLHWVPSDFGGIKNFAPVEKSIWLPILSCLACLEENLFTGEQPEYQIGYDGMANWQPKIKFEASCNIKVRYFPFDEQVCNVYFFPMQFSYLEVQLRNTSTFVNTLVYKENGEWNVTKSTLNSRIHPQTFKSLLEVSFMMARRPAFFIQNIVSPIVLLSFLNLFAFCLPDDSGEKISFSLTMLLSQTVFLSTVSGSLPSTSIEVVFITYYITFLLVISCLISISSILLLYFHHKRKKQEEKEDEKKDEVIEEIKNEMLSGENQENGTEVGKIKEATPSAPGFFIGFIKTNKVGPLNSTSKIGKCGKCTIDKFLFSIALIIWLFFTTLFFAKIIYKHEMHGKVIGFDFSLV